MDNKKFIIIFAILILIIIGMMTYSLMYTIKNSNEEKNINISIDEFNDIILKSNNFQSSRMSDITINNINEILNINSSDINKLYGKKAVINTDASMYLLIEPKQEKYDEIYIRLEEFCIYYEKFWNEYLEAEYDIVIDREMGKINNYIYLIISDDSYDIIREVNLI